MSNRYALSTAVLALAMAASPALAFEPVVSLPGEHKPVTIGADTHQVLVTRDQTGGQFGVIILSNSAGAGPGPAITHARESESWYVLEGVYEFHIGEKVFEGGPGTFVAVDAGQPHGFIAKEAGKLLVTFTPGGYENFFIDWAEDLGGMPPGPEVGKLENQYGVTRPVPRG